MKQEWAAYNNLRCKYGYKDSQYLAVPLVTRSERRRSHGREGETGGGVSGSQALLDSLGSIDQCQPGLTASQPASQSCLSVCLPIPPTGSSGTAGIRHTSKRV